MTSSAEARHLSVRTTLLVASLCARPVRPSGLRRLPIVPRSSIQLRAMPTKPEVLLLPATTSASTRASASDAPGGAWHAYLMRRR